MEINDQHLPDDTEDISVDKAAAEQESFPESGNQTQTGASTDYSDPDNEPDGFTDDEDDEDNLTSDIA